MATVWKRRKSNDGFPPFPQRLGNLAKAARFPHSHSSCGLLWLNQTTPGKELGGVEKWKSKRQDSHFPTPPMACGARKKILKVYTMRPVRCVYHAPVLTHNRVNALASQPNHSTSTGKSESEKSYSKCAC